MSVFFENEFKNESENEIKNESENRCIMLPEEVKGKGYFALTGSKLKAYVEKWLDGIDEAAVVGIPHDIYGEVPVAAVKLSPESILTEQQIQDLLKCRIAKYMIPSRILFLNELPLTPNNKVNKSAIRKLFMQPEQ